VLLEIYACVRPNIYKRSKHALGRDANMPNKRKVEKKEDRNGGSAEGETEKRKNEMIIIIIIIATTNRLEVLHQFPHS
jgi:hypothetical protein